MRTTVTPATMVHGWAVPMTDTTLHQSTPYNTNNHESMELDHDSSINKNFWDQITTIFDTLTLTFPNMAQLITT